MVSAEAKVFLILGSETVGIQPESFAATHWCSRARAQLAKVASSIW
jgi:hypothetical protein